MAARAAALPTLLGTVAVAAPSTATAQVTLTIGAPTFATPTTITAGTAGVAMFNTFTAPLTFGPVSVFDNGRAVGDPLRQTVTFSTAPGSGSLAFIRGTGQVGLGGTVDPAANGVWDAVATGSRQGFSAVSTSDAALRLTFLRPVSAFSAFVNYVPPGFNDYLAPLLRAYAADGSLLASFDIDALAPIRTPGATNAGGWRGFAFTTASVAYVEFGRGGVVLDDATFRMDVPSAGPPTVTPEPGPLALVALGLGGVGLVARRRRPVASVWFRRGGRSVTGLRMLDLAPAPVTALLPALERTPEGLR